MRTAPFILVEDGNPSFTLTINDWHEYGCNRSIEVFAFNTGSKYIGEANESNINNYVKNVFLKQTAVNGGTNYALVMKAIVKQFGFAISEGGGLKKFFSRGITEKKVEPAIIPTFVFFITDGDNWDKSDTEKVIREASKQGIFWQFVGIGSEHFKFLRKLDDLNGRVSIVVEGSQKQGDFEVIEKACFL